MKARKVKSSQPAQSATEYYSFSHKVVSVAMAVVLMGFGWPAVSPAQVFADSDSTESAQSADDSKAEKKAEEEKAKKEAAEKKAAEEKAEKEAAEKKAAEEKAAKAAAEKKAAEKKAAEEKAAKAAAEKKAAEEAKEDSKAEEATEFDVSLKLNNAYIKLASNGQRVAAPSTKVTVPAGKDFKFTVGVDNGYTLSKVKAKLSGSTKTLTANSSDVYTIDASDLSDNITITLVTEKDESSSDDETDATPIEDTENDAANKEASEKQAEAEKATDEGASDSTDKKSDEGTSSNESDSKSTEGESSESGEQNGSEESTDNQSSEQTEDESGDSNSSNDGSSQSWLDQISNFFSGLGGNSESNIGTVSLTDNAATTALGEDTTFEKWIYVGDEVELDGGKYYNHSWTVSDSDIATCEAINTGQTSSKKQSTATVTGLKAGEVTITHTYYTGYSRWTGVYGKTTDTYTIHVVENADFSMTINGDSSVNKGQSTKLSIVTDPLTAELGNVTWTSSDNNVATVESNGNVTGVGEGSATITATTTDSQGRTVAATKTITVVDADFGIVGDSSVEQFKSITLTTKNNGDYDVSWSVNDPEKATITSAGKLTANTTGKVIVTASYVDADGNVVSATKDIEITASTATSTTAYLFFVKSPTDDPESNTASGWLPEGGSHALGLKLNLDNASWSGVNTKDNVANRVISWPDGSTGTSWSLPNSGTYASYWSSVFKNYKTQVEKEAGYTITEDDVTAIVLHPYKISNNSGDYHLDCKVEIKVKSIITATFYLQDAGATGFAQVEAKTYKLTDGKVDVAEQTSQNLPAEKTVNGVRYKLYSWYNNSSFGGSPVSFPFEAMGNVNFYAKYVPMDQTITVNYVDKSTGKNIADPFTITGMEKGQKTTQAAKSIEGYSVIGDKTATLVAGTDSEYTFYYEANDEDYTVNYYLNGTTTSVATSKTGTGKFGSKVSESPVSIDGYTAVSSDAQSITLGTDASKNVINVYYYKNVELTANSDSKTYSGQEQSVEGYTSNVDGASFDDVTLEGGKGTDAGTYAYSFANNTINKVSTDGQYVVTAVHDGALTITPVEDEVIVTIKGNAASETYDGSEKSVEGYEVESISSDLYAANDFALAKGASAKAAGTNAGTYNMGLESGSFVNKNANFANVVFKVEDGSVVVSPADLTLKSADLSKEYDGTALTNGDNAIEASGWAKGEGATYEFTGSQTEVGSSANAFTVKANKGTNLSNYNLEKTEGTLTVSDRAEKYTVTVKANSGSETYDGTEKTVSGVTGTTYTNDKGVTFTITGLEASASGTDAGEYAAKVTGVAKVIDQYGNDVTSQFTVNTEDGKLTIGKAKVILRSADLTKEFDGEDLVNGDTALAEQSGFAEGQGVTCTFTGAQNEPGSSENSFTYIANNGTNLDNYDITATFGALTVTSRDAKYEVTVKANSAKFTYDGSEHAATGVETYEFTVKGKTYTVSGLTTSDPKATHAGTYANNITGTPFVTNSKGKDVSKEFKVSTESGTLTIAKRDLALKSADLSKEYDGTALENGDTKLAEETGWAKGEGATYEFTGSQTDAGSSANAFSVIPSEGTDLTNYEVSKSEGTLKVNKSTKKVTVTVKGSSASGTYDGTTQTASGYELSIDSDIYKAEYVAFDGDATATGTNVGTYKMGLDAEQFSNTNANFSNVEFVVEDDGVLTIGKAKVTLRSADLSKTYDGTELANGDTALAEQSGFVEGQGVTCTFTGSQTDAGSTANAFTYVANEGTNLDNYEISKSEGTLTVTPVADKVTVTIKGNSSAETYDGQAHEATGYVTTSISNELYTADDYGLAKDAKAEVAGTNAGTYDMGLEANSFTNSNKNFSNVEFVIESDGQLVVDPRPVTLTSGSKSWEYDGKTHKYEKYEVGGMGFVDGEGYGVEFTGSQKVVGSSENTFTYEPESGTKASNYSITAVPGTLTVTNRAAKYEVTVKANSGSYTYDGSERSAEGVETYEFSLEGSVYTVSGLTTTDPKATDAGTYANNITGTPVVTDEAGNDVTSQFKVSTENGTLTIGKAKVTLRSADLSKTYDGTELANGDTALAEQSGFVEGQGVTCTFTGSQTDAGSTANAFTYVANEGTNLDNYEISKSEGTLTVSPVNDEVVIKVAGNKGGEKYDGKKQTVSGYTLSDLPSGVTEGDVKYAGTATVEGTNAGTYAMNLDENKFELSGQASKNYTNVKFEVTDGELAIAKRQVTLTSDSGSKNYDGTTITRRGVTVTGDGFAAGENVSQNYTWYDDNNILPGSYTNTFEYTLKKGTDAGNYEITTEFGTLTINDREDKDKFEYTVTGNSTVATYDSQEHSAAGITETTFTNKYGATFNVTADTTDPARTDAGSDANKVSNVKITDDQGNDVTAQFKISTVDGKLTVNKKNATITAGSATKVWDGTELTTDEFETSGFVDGQGIESATIEGSQTDVGSSESSVKNGSWTAKSGTNLDNYSVSTANGTLTVTNRDAKFEISLQAKGSTTTYNGSEQSVSGLVSDTFVNNGQTYTVSGLTVGAKGTDAGTYQTTTAGSVVVKDAKGNDVTQQFNIVVEPAKLVINKKAVTLKSADLEKKYDGTPLTNGNTALATNEGFVEGQGITATFNGSQTAVGSSDNAFTIAANEGTNLDNYQIAQTAGTLTVKKSDAKVVVTIVGNTDTQKYNASEQEVTGYKVTGITVDGDASTLFTQDDIQFNGSAVATQTNVGTAKMGLAASQFDSTNENFKAENVTFKVTDGSMTVTTREITLTSATDSKAYDGTALANGTVVVGGDGFVANEGATYDVTGSITNAGVANNEFTYEFAKGTKASNYTVAKSEGTLTVTPVADKVTVIITGHNESTTYDGTVQSATGYDVSIDNALYKEGYIAFGGTAKVEKTDAGTYAMGLAADQFSNKSENFSNVEFVVNDGKLDIAKREVTLKSADATKVYDGKALTNKNVTVGGEGFAKGEGASYDVTGSQTTVGSSKNAFTYTLNKGTKADNYTIAQTEGTLTVTSRDAKYEITVEANSATASYDGTEHEASGLKTTEFEIDGNKYTVSGLATDNPKQKDAGTYTNGITGTPLVKDAAGNDVTGEFSVKTVAGTLQIDKASVTLKSASAEKAYDGTELAKHEMETTSGFANGEGVDVTYTGTITNVGTTQNAYTYVASEGTNLDNYNIEQQYGELKVTANTDEITVTINGNTDFQKYNGSEQKVTGYSVMITKAGQETTLYTTADFNAPTQDEAVAKGTNASDDVYAMGLNEGQFSNKSENFSNVKFVVNDGGITISKRDVNLKSESGEKAYDGTALTMPEVTVTGDGFVAGEVNNLKANGSVINNGDEATNNITYDHGAAYKDSNYNVAFDEGTLKITAGTIDAKKVVWNTQDEQKVYDGTALQTYAASATDKHGSKLTVEYSTDGTNWTTDSSQITITHYGVTEVQLRATNDNYADGQYATSTEYIAITKRPVSFTSATDAKVFDGEALTNDKVTVSETGKGTGFVSGEGASFDVTGSQTAVGSSKNTFSYSFNQGTSADDYWVTKIEGTLTVTSRGATETITVKSNSATATYDGKSHEAAGFETLTFEIDGKTYTVEGLSTADPSETDAGTYENAITGTAKVLDSKGNDVTSEFNVVPEAGTLKIDPREVTIVSGSASKAYDGTELTEHSWKYADGSDEFVGTDAEKLQLSYTGTITDFGTAKNEFSYDGFSDGVKASNYKVNTKTGELEITANTNKVTVTITEHSGTATYDGSAHEVTGYDVETSNKLYTADSFSFNGDDTVSGTNAGSYGMDLKPGDFTNKSKNFSNVEFVIVDGTLDIAKRKVTLRSADGEWTYDGTAHTNGTVSVGEDGFVKGEGASYDVKGTITNAGNVANEFGYTLNKGTNADNYTISKTEGTLKVNPVTEKVVVTVTGNMANETYDNTAKSAEGYKLSADNALYNTDAVEFSGAAKVEKTNAGEYAMGLAVDQFSNKSDNFSNVEFVVNDGKLVIAKREVTLTSATDSKTYDGKALTNDEVKVTKGSFVKGQGFKANVTGTQTLVGTSDNTFTYTLTGGATEGEAGNYVITTVPGTLTVNDRDAKFEITVTGNSDSFLYDGTEKNVSGITQSEYVMKNGAKYTVTATTGVSAVNAGEYANNVENIVVKDENGNDVTKQFKITPVAGKLTISKRNVTITSGSDSREYNGEALTKHEVEVAGDGFAANEGASYDYTGAITNAGKAKNEFAYTLNDGTDANNYNIKLVDGTLTVTPVTATVKVTITGNSATKHYTGSEQSVIGYVFSSDNSLYKESDIKFTGDATAKGTETGSYDMGLEAGQFSNVNTKNFSSVEFTVNDGNLTIDAAPIDADEVKWATEDVQHKYDGKSVSAGIATATDKYGNALEVQYSIDGTNWVDDPSQITATNYGDSTIVQLRAKSDNYSDYAYDSELLSINKRTLKFESASATKAYDGTALTRNEQTDVSVAGDGFVEGEGVTFDITGSQTDVGSSANSFTYSFDETTTKSENYWVLSSTPGTLEVTASEADVTVTIQENSGSYVYDGTEKTVEGYKIKSISSKLYKESDFSFAGNASVVGTDAGTYQMELKPADFTNNNKNFSKVNFVIEDGTLEITSQSINPKKDDGSDDPAYKGIKIDSPKDVTYDGQSHMWVPTVTDEDGNTLNAGTDYVVSYSTTDFTNATGEITVTITGAGNYTGTVTKTYKINKRQVSLKSESGNKTYDGTALTKPTVTGWAQSGNTGFVSGEVADVKATGSVTYVDEGKVDNAITYTKAAGFNENNYEITLTQGKLSIDPLAGVTVKIKGATATYTYDGLEKTVTGHDVTSISSKLYSASDFVLAQDAKDEAKGTSFGKYVMGLSGESFVNNNSNFKDVTFEVTDGWLEIQPAGVDNVDLVDVSQPEDVVYNGNAQEQPVTVTNKTTGETLTEGVDYTISYSDDVTNAGTVTVTITGTGNYSGAKKVTYKINPREYTVTTPSASKVFDGKALTATDGASVGNLASDNDVTIEATGTITDPGTTTNTYKLTWKSDQMKANYKLAENGENLGTLMVTNSEEEVVVTTQGGTYTYDGQSHGATVTVDVPEGYVVKDATCSDSAINATGDEGIEAKNVSFVITTADGVDVTNELKYTYNYGKIVINKRPVTLTSADDSKVYDGTALTNGTVTATATAEGVGFVEGEGVDYNVTGSQTEVGDSKNSFEFAAKEGTNLDNYSVTKKEGTLSVSKAQLDQYLTLAVEGVTKTYDGSSVAINAATATGLPEGNEVKIQYSINGKAWVDDPSELAQTDANTYAITVKATSEKNYKGSVTKTVDVVINKRAVKLESNSQTKVYDGIALTDPSVSGTEMSGDTGFVAGEATATATGSQIEVGSTTNAISVNWATGKADNYDIIKTEGTLKVTPQSINPGPDPENPDPSYSGVTVNDPENVTYDGNEHKWVPTVTDKDGKDLTEGKDYKVTYTDKDGNEVTDFTNVTGEITVTITGSGNYSGTITKVYQITAKGYQVETPSKTKVYDGTALMAKGTITGLVSSKDAELVTTGKITKPGSTENTYKINWASDQMKANYTLTSEVIGTLTVTNSKDEIVVTTTGGTFTYDGQTHEASINISKLPTGYKVKTAHCTDSATDVTTDPVKAENVELVITTLDGTDVTKDLTIKYVTGEIVVVPATLTVTTPDASKVYDGTALTSAGTISGFVNGETATFATTGTQTEVGTTDNTYSIDWNGTAKQSNYTVDETMGKLEVKAQSIKPGDDTYKGVEIDNPADVTYDGNEHKWVPTVTDKDGKDLTEGKDYKVTYTDKDGNEVTDFTNVTGEITVTITGTGNYAGTVTKTYEITKATATVTTESASKYYDGKPLTAGGSIELVNGETATVKMNSSITNVGTEANDDYEVVWDGTAKEGNYKVVTGTTGTLEVKAQSIDPEDSDPDAYAGVKIDSPENVPYDSKTHKWAPTVTDSEGKTLTEGKDYKVAYSTKDFTNAGTITVTITGTGNYGGTVTKTYQITKVNATIITDSASKVYDGEELKASGRIEGLVNKSDVTTFEATGSQTKVGASTNTYVIEWKNLGVDVPDMSRNYNVTEQLGKLVVTESEETIVAAAVGGTYTYDGQAHSASVWVSDLPKGYTLQAATSNATATNVREGYVTANVDNLVIVNKEGEDVTSKLDIVRYSETIKIVPAELTVTTGSSSKVYDGTALTNGNLTINGIVGSDVIFGKTTGQQTTVGKSANTYSITWGEVDAMNYKIIENLGTLTVTAANTPGNDDNNGNDNGNTPIVTPAGPTNNGTVINNGDNGGNNGNDANGNEERIYDADNPMGTTEAECWVHYYMIILMIMTALYGIGVWARRANYVRKLNNDKNDVLGDGDSSGSKKTPVATNQTAGVEA